jgi:hypothetical protein
MAEVKLVPIVERSSAVRVFWCFLTTLENYLLRVYHFYAIFNVILSWSRAETSSIETGSSKPSIRRVTRLSSSFRSKVIVRNVPK